jgi:hypothetical protein
MATYYSVPLHDGQTFYSNPPPYHNHHQQYDQHQQYSNQHQQYQFSQNRPWNSNPPYNAHQHYSSQTSFNPSVNTSYLSQTSFPSTVPQTQELERFIIEDPMKIPQSSILEVSPPRRARKHRKRRRLDYFNILLTLAVWVFLTLACLVLLYYSYAASQRDSDGGIGVTGTEIGQVILLSSAPLLIATVLNEVLVERCWRRVVYAALGNNAGSFTDAKKAVHLRAANFEWIGILKRIFTHELSWRDLRSLVSYGLLRWGTAVSIAAAQLCVSWIRTDITDDDGINLYIADKKPYVVLLPVFLHAVSIFGTSSTWLLAPWAMFSGRYDADGLLDRYRPYLERVRYGSIAKYETVARYLNPGRHAVPELKTKHKPGLQFVAKLKGISAGLLLMGLAPGAAWLYTWRTQQHNDGSMIRYGLFRFGFHFLFLAQNIFYILALDFVVWNLSLEGFCKTTKAKPNRSLRHLGYSSGLMLLWRAFWQRRPWQAAIFMWMFWVQAVLVRSLTVLYALITVFFRYQAKGFEQGLFYPGFWLEYIKYTVLLVLPLFTLWIFTSFQAPIAAQDGWRWAKIAVNALESDGFYGVRNNEAVWGEDVESFRSVGKTTLL